MYYAPATTDRSAVKDAFERSSKTAQDLRLAEWAWTRAKADHLAAEIAWRIAIDQAEEADRQAEKEGGQQ